MQATERSAGYELKYPTPSRFVGVEAQAFVLIGLALPILFMLLNAQKIYLLPPQLADSIIAFFGHVSPVLEPQYEAIKRLRTIEDASNYSAFMLILLIVATVFLGHAVYRIIIERKSIGRTRWTDVGVTILCLFWAVLLQLLDLPQPNPKPIFNFYVDSFGTYFLRQFVLFACVYLSVLLLLASVVKAFDRRSG